MDKEKKKELAEMDSRWDFQKTVKTAENRGWDDLLNKYNNLQDQHGDLYMAVSKFSSPNFTDKAKMWLDSWHRDLENTVTFEHRQVYQWFEALAAHQQISVGHAVWKVFNKLDELRQELNLGETMNVEINNVDAMEKPEHSKVSKDELKEMIEDD